MIDRVFGQLSNIIKAPYKNSFTGGKVVLKDSTSKDVTIKKTGSFLCVQLDRRGSNIFTFFETSVEHLCKISDRIIFYPKGNSLFVFIIELKSSNPTGAFKQVLASYELSKYICFSAKRLENYPNVDIQYRGIIFSSKAIIKGTTKPKNLAYTQCPNTALKYRHLQSGFEYDLDLLSF